MRYVGLPVILVFAVLVLAAPIASAQLSDEYVGWADGPQGFLLTKKEKKEWDTITSDDAAARFIKLFWARRNPEPNSSFNAFKAEFDAKVLFADQNFAYRDRRGSLSDRGQVLILMGRPDGRQVREPERPGGGGADTTNQASEVWIYDPANLPAELKAKGANLFFVFYEEGVGSNHFVLDTSSREGIKAKSSLSRAPEAFLLHPDLDEVPLPVSVSNAVTASASSLKMLETTNAPYDGVVIVIAELGVSDGVHQPLWVHLELPPDAPKLDLLAGKVSAVGGEDVSTFEKAATPLDGQNGTAYHLAFPLQEGTYTIAIVGTAGGVPQFTHSLEAKVSTIPTDGPWMSMLWCGIGASPHPEAKLGEPFTFGGWHMIPVSGPEMTRENEITYFGFLVRPGLDDEGAVELEVKIRVKRDGKALGRPFTAALETSKIYGDLYMYGNSIGLSGLPEPGPYEIEFTITDKISQVSVERSLPVEIGE
jgi:GWxTD domain-containing protein